ncbi:MAG: ATP-binding protein [Verrucomicrobiota bacterium]
MLAPTEEIYLKLSIYKGLFFVTVTSLLLSALIFRLAARMQRVRDSLRASERDYRELVDSVNSIVLRWNHSGEVTFANEFALKFFGYSKDELVGENLLDTVFPRIDHVAQHLRQMMADVNDYPECYANDQSEAVRRDGERVWIAWTNRVLRDQTGAISEILSVGNDLTRDITERNRAEAALIRAKEAAEAANRAKDQFIAVLSHELRTPLTPVLAMVSALQEESGLPPEFRADMELIHRNVELEARLIDDLLDVTRISRGKVELHRENINLHDCLQMALDICAGDIRAKSLEISPAFDAPQHFVWADPARLQQVFWNLLKNAIKFTPARGRISVRTENAGSRVRIRVADSGIGIAPEVLPRIFNTFEQGEQSKHRQFGGLGLGLSIARAVVELHQGTLYAYSGGKDQGSTFITELETVLPDLEVHSGARFKLDSSEPELRKVLMVDDHPDTLRILSRMVGKWGFCVRTATCVREALALAASERFDLVISDLGLPDGSGQEIMRETKMRYGLRGIAISGYGSDSDLRESEEAGFDTHLIKPISFQALKTAIHRITAESVPA